MDRKQSELKARLLAAYESALDEALAKPEAINEMTLNDIEDLALAVGGKVEQQLSQALVAVDKGQMVPGPQCPGCGREMRYKGQKKRYIETRSGSVAMERAYYYCKQCRRGFFPPG